MNPTMKNNIRPALSRDCGKRRNPKVLCLLKRQQKSYENPGGKLVGVKGFYKNMMKIIGLEAVL